jgi:hypothetical protein
LTVSVQQLAAWGQNSDLANAVLLGASEIFVTLADLKAP